VSIEFTQLMDTQRISTDAMMNFATQYEMQDRTSPAYLKRLNEAQKYLTSLQRRQTRVRLQEAMTTSDFPNLFGDILSRRLAADYVVYSAGWTNYAERRSVPDFRNVKSFAVYGGDQLLDQVPEGVTGAGYKAVNDRELADYRVDKYIGKIRLPMEAIVNDDLGAFNRLPTKLATGARRTEDRFATGLYAGTSGPLSTVYKEANGNVVTGNPELSIQALQTAIQVIGNQTDENGLPIFVDLVTLVVPPALATVARNILNATQVEVGIVGQGNAEAPANEQRIITTNWTSGQVQQLVVNPWLPYIATTNGDKSWYLFASPNTGRPAIEMGFLSMLNGPVVFRRRPDAIGLTGGNLPIGDFDSNCYEWGVMHVFGGQLTDYRMTVASNGSGS
jgi:hypothetical protein